jgi:CheY-like chemotaxis protein
VLIVDDNAATAVILSSIVADASSHAEVRVASDGATALDMIRDRAPDVLVVDLHLPGMSGVELCRLVSCLPTADWTTVVATSSHATKAQIETLRRLECVQYFPKGDVLATKLPALVRAAARRSGGRFGR